MAITPFRPHVLTTDILGMRETRQKKLVENNSPNAICQKQLAETQGRIIGRKLTRRMIIKCNLVEQLQTTHRDNSVLIMN